MKRWWVSVLAILLLSVAIAGCNGSGGKEEGSGIEAFDADGEAAIKVMFYDEQAFFREYGSMFQMKYPNVEIEVVSTQSLYTAEGDLKEAMDKLIEEQKPDVLMLGSADYQRLSEEGKLVNLDQVVAQHEFDIENLHPALVETLKQQGNGALYGLAPTMGAEVVFYNKQLFDEFGVPYPTDQMSWDQLFELAQRFPTDGSEEDRIYGFFRESYGGGVGNSVLMVGSTYGLTWVDETGSSVTMNSESWRDVLESVIQYESSGVIGTFDFSQQTVMTDYAEMLKRNKFNTGQAAMTMGGYYTINQLKELRNVLPDQKPFEWDIVTMPVDPARPDVTSNFYVFDIFAINAESPNLSASWALVEFINSDQMAKTMSKSTFNLLARPDHMPNDLNLNMDAFYKLKPDTVQLYSGLENLPRSFYEQFSKILNEETEKVLKDEQTIDEALANIEDRGNLALEQAKLDKASEEEAEQAE